MFDSEMAARVSGQGFFAALDQSGGSTPGALRLYGIPDDAYHGEAEMFALIHEMRMRVMTAPAFTGSKVVGAILFERTMDATAAGKPIPSYLWQDRGVVPFLKVDKGLAVEANGVRLMKPISDLEPLLVRAAALGVFGTKMRSVITLPDRDGIASVVRQQFDIALQIASHGLMPIVEPEILIGSPDKRRAEAILLEELTTALDAIPAGTPVMLKLTLPDVPDLFAPLTVHPRVARVLALSGGYSRAEACRRLAANHGVIASFSRALIEDLTASMSDAEFDAALTKAIDEIYTASVEKA
ncbi:fructose bisphosphate aldolase [Methylobacterium sp. ID0610]|uniref:fructose bisphosphate aldolase n=1 Tax=Methylobacterium carpenticola TaxID=3344827 RepID=UPI0036BD55A5